MNVTSVQVRSDDPDRFVAGLVKAALKPKETFGASLRRLRLQSGMSQRDVAAFMDVSANYVCNVEKCRRKPTPETALAFAEALNLPLADFGALPCTRCGNLIVKGAPTER